MKINILTLPSTEFLAVGERSLGNWAQLKIGEEPKDSEFDERATKEFRASRHCIVNPSHAKQPRLKKDGALIFVMRNGKEVVFSRRQGAFFR